jgi:single-strand DNA-binding protein
VIVFFIGASTAMFTGLICFQNLMPRDINLIFNLKNVNIMEAKVFVSGKLGNNANVIQFENGRAVITFSIATNSYYTNSAGEQVQNTTWHDCKKFVRTVNEKLVEKLVKGVTVTIMGTLQYEEYEKPVTKTKSTKIKKAYIDVAGLEIS